MDIVGLTEKERAYVEARSQTTTKLAAFRLAGISHATYYLWPKERQEYLEALVQDHKASLSQRALQILEQNAEAAAQVKADGLNSDKDHIAQAAADSILDRVLGRAKQPIEQSGTLTVNVHYGRNRHRPAKSPQQTTGDNGSSSQTPSDMCGTQGGQDDIGGDAGL